jgi:hypothetical protein
MEFVNSIARIVHTSCALHGGAANKNIGDAFLLVWKFPKGFTARDLQEVAATRNTVPSSGAATQGLSSISEAGDPVTRGNSSSTTAAPGAVSTSGGPEAAPPGGERSLRGSTVWPSLQTRRIMAQMTSSLQGRDRPLLSVPFAGSHTAAAGVAGLPGSPKPRLVSMPLSSNQVMPLPLLARGSQALGGLSSAGPSQNVEDDLDNVALRKVSKDKDLEWLGFLRTGSGLRVVHWV